MPSRADFRSVVKLVSLRAGRRWGLQAVRPRFEIHERQENGELRLSLSGDLDIGTASRLTDRLKELQADSFRVRLDLSELDFIDSTGVRVLVEAVYDARVSGWPLDVEPSFAPQVSRVLKLVRVERYILGYTPDPPELRSGSLTKPSSGGAR